MQAIQNLGLAVVPIIAGLIVDRNGYLMLEVFFCAMVCISLIAGETSGTDGIAPGTATCHKAIVLCSHHHCHHCHSLPGILLYVLDSAKGGKLNKTAWTRRKEEKEQEEKEKAEM